MTLYLKDTTHIDWQTLAFQTTHLAVAPGIDGGVELLETLPSESELDADDSIFDCRNRLVTKSFVCGHHHIYSALARGMPPPSEIPQNFPEILEYIWWRVDKTLDKEMIEASALVSALYCIKNGVTFVIDHHASPFAIPGSLETIAAAFDRVGISHLLCYEMSDRDGEGPRKQGLQETADYLSSGRQGHVGLHASFTVGHELLQKAVALAHSHNTGIHVHVAEDTADQEACQRDHGQRVLERFRDAGVLDLQKSILAHCIHLDDAEKKLLRNSGVWVVQNVESNQNNNVGLANCAQLGEHIMLGTDGMHSDMLRSAKAAFLSGQVVEGIDFDGIYRRFRNAHTYIQTNGFSGDDDNNLVILDYNAPTEINADNFLGHFVYGLDSSHVDSVVSCGKLAVKNRRLLTVDEDEILAFSREMGNKLWKKL
ncbi:MAG: amidohydrolase family protein [Deltaproteobacteria bacterium]|jgi:cytosine/adenosine deaminase-related metal-dependent hydrolase|nr:amidohydrolase family protein [Deltaproteobacteria bacterium]